MRRSLRLGQRSQFIQVAWNWLSQTAQSWRTRLKSPPDSTDYLAWRHHFLQKRLRLGLRLTLFWHLLISAEAIYSVLFEFERFRAVALRNFGETAIADQWRGAIIVYHIVANLLLAAFLIGQKTAWGRRYPTVLFLISAYFLSSLVQIVFTFFGVPEPPATGFFLSIAVLIPVHWRLHLTYQALSIAGYAIVYLTIGLAALEYTNAYSIYSRETILHFASTCSISVLSVYLYERLKRSEFEANRRLQVFLHSVSHDLQTPVVGSSIVLKSLLGKPQQKREDEIRVKRSTIARLLQGSDRQLALIHSLLEAHTTEIQGVTLHREPILLKPIVDSVLFDLHYGLTKQRIQLTHHITENLPLVNADANQLWRVFSNLIGNVLKHNPPGIQLGLDAQAVKPGQKLEEGRMWRDAEVERAKQLVQPKMPMLLCVVQDNGVGIATEQRQRLFELYARGSQARYMPGLGLGLYLCQKIIQAHGGEIGVISRPGEGSTFWFTLPLYPA